MKITCVCPVCKREVLIISLEFKLGDTVAKKTFDSWDIIAGLECGHLVSLWALGGSKLIPISDEDIARALK